MILSEVNCRHRTNQRAQPGVALVDSARSLRRVAENERTSAARRPAEISRSEESP